MEQTTKYPRTYHLPFSEGLTNDDRKVDDNWWDYLAGHRLVLTEKLDGENQSIYKTGVFARSHAAPTENPWSINMKDIYYQVRDFLAEDEGIYGENLYAVHSILYNRLPAYFFMFAMRNSERWYSFDEVLDVADMLNLHRVPVIETRIFTSPEDLEHTIKTHMQNRKSEFGDTMEGIVVRVADSFFLEDFSKYVVKFVRANHVQTDVHWKRNWQRAKLIYENDLNE